LVDITAKPIFLPIVRDRNPRTECGCQPVSFHQLFGRYAAGLLQKIQDFGRFTASCVAPFSPVAFFVALGAFLAVFAFLPDLAFFGATWEPRQAAV
jgi:hypothetical protein